MLEINSEMPVSYLQWCTSQDESVLCVVVLSEHHSQLGVGILHTMALINNHVQPLHLTENRSILDNVFECCKKHLEIIVADFILEFFTSVWRTLINNSFDGRCPFLEFQCPISESAIKCGYYVYRHEVHSINHLR